MKKKIMFLIPTLMHGGAEKVLVNLVNHMNKEKYDVTLHTLFDCGVNKEFLDDTVQYKSNFKHIFRGNTKLMLLLSPKALYQMLIKGHYDVIVSFLEGPTARILSGCPYKDTKKIAWIHIEQHTKKIFSKAFRSYEEAKKVYYSFDRIISVSKTVRDDFEKLSCIKNTDVLYNVNDTDNILRKTNEIVEDFEFSKDVITFCSVAKVTKTKGYERLARIHKRLIDEGLDHRIIIVGTGEDEKKIYQYCKENKIDDSFILLGFKKNPYKYMKNSDAYVCSSFREGFSTAVTEALVIGLPCISTNCSGAYELLGEDNEYGIVVDNDEDSIYQGMKKLLENRTLLDYYRVQSKKRGTRFSTEKTVKAVENMIDEVLKCH